MNNLKFSCSILKADFLNLNELLIKLSDANINKIHYDVMDNVFVPNLSFGPWVLECINAKFDFNIDIHFMVNVINNSIEEYFKPYIQKNVKQFTVHFEAFTNEQLLLIKKMCNKNNIKFSIAINPKTNIDDIKHLFNEIDNILVMGVEPGFGGQVFNEIALTKAIILKKERENIKNKFTIQVDGGVNENTINKILDVDFDNIVVGTWFTNNLNNIKDLVKKYGK